MRVPRSNGGTNDEIHIVDLPGQRRSSLIEENKMKYMLLVYLDEQAMTEEEREHCYVESAQLAQSLDASGQYLDASPLHPFATATSLRVRAGRRVVTDGPFAESPEQLAGSYLI